MTNATLMSREDNDAEAFAESLARVDEEMPAGGVEASVADMYAQQNPNSPALSSEAFRAETPLGEVVFGIWTNDDRAAHDVTANGSHCLRAALCLGRAEPLICLLEDWLGVPLDLAPGASIPPQDGYFRVEWTPPDSAAFAIAKKAVIYLPLDTLAHLSTPPAALAAAMRWDAVSCELTISSAAVPRQQLGWLEPGGLMLMPASFEPFWRCQAGLSAHPAQVFTAELDAGQQRLIFEPYESTAADAGMGTETLSADAEQIEVVLRHELPISVDRLTGWAEHPLFELGRTLPEFEVEIRGPQGVLAHGDLMPVGNGYGVFVRSVTGVHAGYDTDNT